MRIHIYVMYIHNERLAMGVPVQQPSDENQVSTQQESYYNSRGETRDVGNAQEPCVLILVRAVGHRESRIERQKHYKHHSRSANGEVQNPEKKLFQVKPIVDESHEVKAGRGEGEIE